MTIKQFFSYAELRAAFLSFFKQKGHEILQSSSLIPGNDPTLLFTNAGMVQFKDVFLGLDKRSYTKATTAQCCVRAGGKHNDLENVGYTARHHTFFEMLGNFSFGDYFKREAIQFAWEFLTDILKLPPEKLWITVFEKDQEAADIWLKEINVDPSRFSYCGEKDNFWSMGDTGPCGPCTEIFYDHGSEIAGGPPGSPDADGDRYVEIWNLVFMQFDRNESGELTPLPKPSVDTGMGLERLAAVMQGVQSNYETDLFIHLIQAIGKLGLITDLNSPSLRVIADHIRSTSFLIADGVMPSNEGRGYVLRRIIRRAIRHGNKLGFQGPFFYKLVSSLVELMEKAYPKLKENQAHIETILLQEEEQFAKTLEHGLKVLAQDLLNLNSTVIAGETIFRLYDTYGFPVDLTADIARERGLSLDYEGFETAMENQRRLSQESGKFNQVMYHGGISTQTNTEFQGYESDISDTLITELFFNGQPIAELKEGEEGAIILSHTPFYGESGGQIGDQGSLFYNDTLFIVKDTQKQGHSFIHYGQVQKGQFKLNQAVKAEVDIAHRQSTARNHTATHLLHAALRKYLGKHIVQKGSLVEAERLRFDFSHYETISKEQLNDIEKIVNQQIRTNTNVITQVMSPDVAINKGAIGLFGEKYSDSVRVLNIGDFSMELCGGIHVKQTGDIGYFKIISETGIAAGIRRIEAITGDAVDNWISNLSSQLTEVADILRAQPDTVTAKVSQLIDKNRTLEKLTEQLQAKLANSSSAELLQQAKLVKGVHILSAELMNTEIKILREMTDKIKNKLGSAVIILGSVSDGRVNLVVGVSKDCIDRIKAGELANFIAQQVGGKGGGRPDMAQAGGNIPEVLPTALASAYAWVESQL
ncbi:MAG: Alanine--tRNA ligase [Legionellaceae bacterium]